MARRLPLRRHLSRVANKFRHFASSGTALWEEAMHRGGMRSSKGGLDRRGHTDAAKKKKQRYYLILHRIREAWLWERVKIAHI